MQMTPLPIIPNPADLEPADIGMTDDAHGRRVLDEYIQTFLKWKGRIIATDHKQEYIPLGHDDGEWRYWVEVTVWDSSLKTGHTFTSDSYEVYHKQSKPMLATVYAPCYTRQDWVDYHRWYTSVWADNNSSSLADADVADDTRKLKEQRDALAHPAPARGQTYKVVAGRKHPKGTTGKLFWWGSNNYGESYGLALNDERDQRGRFKNVIFVASKNLELVPDSTTAAAIKKLDDEIATNDQKRDGFYINHYLTTLSKWAKRYNYDAAVTMGRVADLMRNRGEKKKADLLQAASKVLAATEDTFATAMKAA